MCQRTIIIAEAGVNHNGNIQLAKKLIDIAVKSGVDYVKFQSFKSKLLVTETAEKANYQKLKAENLETQFEMLSKLELSQDDQNELMNYCLKKKIKFLSSAFDLESLAYLNKLDLDYIKIPSGEIDNLQYLKKVGSFRKKVLISTGMSNLDEIRKAINILTNFGTNKDRITILHCNTEYPTPMVDVNLNVIKTLKDEFGVSVGYSDHTLGIEVPIAAVALGASVIEKHFTMDKKMEGPDHACSLEPYELKLMVEKIRNIEMAMGSRLKQVTESECLNKIKVRKSIHTLIDLPKGHIIQEIDLLMIRPGDGISPMDMDQVIGRKLKMDLKAGVKLDAKFFL